MLLSMGMLFFFTLGASMVGDICDEDELNTGHRSEGSFYSIFWWFIKMGTALASFVAGALIVFTMFDETQVTKVDALQGNIREIRSKVQYWEGSPGLRDARAEWLDKARMESRDALKESKEYLNYLEKESLKKQEPANHADTVYQSTRRNMLRNALNATKSNVIMLEQLQQNMQKLNPQAEDSLTRYVIEEAIHLTLQTKLEKARMNSFELMAHIDVKSWETKNSRDHYEMLTRKISGVNDRLSDISTAFSLDLLDKELATMENEIIILTKQTPYTLLMMRVVEIGLPVLLSIFSIFFVLRFSLTEKRCHEIKELLRQRNMEHSG
jgi:small-conductance mechanosensitive channel